MKNLVRLNKVLLSKWYWHFAIRRGVLWNDIIGGKYGEIKGGWCSDEVMGGYCLGIWKAVQRGLPVVSSRLSYVIGNRLRVKILEGCLVWECSHVFLSPPYLLCLLQGSSECGTLGVNLRRERDESFFAPDLLMIGKWGGR